MRVKSVSVLPSGDKWAVKSEGCERAYRILETQKEAIEVGKKLAMNRKSQLLVYRLDGSLRSKDSYINDPFPPRK